MKRYLLIVLFFIIPTVFLTAQNNSQIFRGKEFSITFNEEWNLDTSGIAGSAFFLFSKPENNLDQFRENISLLIQNLKGYNVSLDEYIKVSEQQVKLLINDSKIEQSERIAEKGVDIHKLIYTGTQGVYNLKYLQYIFIKDEKAYVLTFTAEEKKFEQYLMQVTQILNSFTFNS